MTRRRSFPSNPRRDQGAVLFVSLILLLILTLIGITAAKLQTSEEGMARNETNHQLAVQSAEAALRDGETLVGLHGPADFTVNNNGLFELTSETQGAGASSVADTIDWNNPGTQSMPYSGPALGSVATPPQPAQLIIESLPPAAVPGGPLCTPGYGSDESCSVYRITAHANGGDSTAAATLQSIYH